MCKFICYIFCLSGRAVICIVYLAGDTIAALRTSALEMAAAYLECELRRIVCWPAAYPECELQRIVCWLLPIRSASSGVLFVGC